MQILTEDRVADYQRDGYVLIPDLFTPQEVKAMIAEVEGGGRVAQTARGNEDASGKKAKLAIWHELGDDIWAAASTCPRIVNNVRVLVGEEIAFFHGKVMLKEAQQGGAWEWHQDYGYWYNQGFVYPRMISAFAALDPGDKRERLFAGLARLAQTRTAGTRPRRSADRSRPCPHRKTRNPV